MKKTSLLVCFIAIAMSLAAQTTSPSQILAGRIAQKMRDSLSLTTSQYDQIYQVNLNLANQKLSVRQQSGARDSLVHHLQQIENQRDTLYYPVLTAPQYQLYKSKKRFLVNAQ